MMKKSKKVLVCIISAILMIGMLTSCGGNPGSNASLPNGETLSGLVKTGGSTSVEKVMNSLIYRFQEINRDVTVEYEMNGSGDGIQNTLSGMYEIGHSSRELKTDGSEDGLIAIPYAIDGITIVVNPQNPVQNLTKEQLFKIYTGQITNWSEVGGNDAMITLVTREASSGTRAAFTEIVGLNKKGSDGQVDPSTVILASATECKDTGAVQTTVAQNPNAIGYMSFSDVDNSKVKSLQYEGVGISSETLQNGTYQLKRNFLLLTKDGATLSSAAQAFINFILSEEGQQIVMDTKLLSVQ